MKKGTLLQTISLEKEAQVRFDQVYPIEPVQVVSGEVSYFIDDENQTMFDNVFYANRIMLKSTQKQVVEIMLGEGYTTEKAGEWNQSFITEDIWQGGDGIFSFNLENGKDCFDQDKQAKTLFVFGDTFVGRYDKQTNQRLDPHLMPNNSLAYLKDKNLSFHLNRGEQGDITGYYHLPEKYDEVGPVIRNIISYHTESNLEGYLSSYYPEKLEILFDFHQVRHITQIDLYNYYSSQSTELSKRGLKKIALHTSLDNQTYQLLETIELKPSQNEADNQVFNLTFESRYLKFVIDTTLGIGNHNDESFKEGLFGLNKVKFYQDDRLLTDIEVKTNSLLHKEQTHAWLWLQDGVVIKDQLYFLPLVVTSDLTQPEGLQFKILGVSMFRTPIKNQEVHPHLSEVKWAPVFAYEGQTSIYFGAGIYSNTENSGALNPDGYIYVYGYKTTYGLREMVVARVKEDRFEYFDEWEYYNGTGYTSHILESAPLLGHISCEMSVSQIKEGRNKGKYMAVFTYDVNTKYVAFAIGDSPVGPFSKPQKIYVTPEQDIFKETTYTYNAKAHPHLSQSKKILVSYNTNTYDFKHNMSHREIYRPRFIYLCETE